MGPKQIPGKCVNSRYAGASKYYCFSFLLWEFVFCYIMIITCFSGSITPLAIYQRVSSYTMEFLATWLSNWYVFLTSVSHKEADNGTRGGKARVGTAEESFHCLH